MDDERDRRNRAERSKNGKNGQGAQPEQRGAPTPPFGAASVSLLIELLARKARAAEWAPERQRAHARAILEVVDEYYFTDEEQSMLAAIASAAED